MSDTHHPHLEDVEDDQFTAAHWLNWRCGIALGAARENLRTGHALLELPQTRAAFASGALSYSTARAITRVATAANEACLLACAHHGTASHVEKLVRLYRRRAGTAHHGYTNPIIPASGEEATDPADAERQAAAHRHDHRMLHRRWDDDGFLLLTARLTPDQGALVVEALDAAAEALQQDRPEVDDSNGRPRHDNDLTDARTEFEVSSAMQRHRQNRRADALALMADAMLQHTHVTANTADRFQVVVHVDEQVLSRSVPASDDGQPDCYIENGVGIAVESARRLCCDSKLVAMPLGRWRRDLPGESLPALFAPPQAGSRRRLRCLPDRRPTVLHLSRRSAAT